MFRDLPKGWNAVPHLPALPGSRGRPMRPDRDLVVTMTATELEALLERTIRKVLEDAAPDADLPPYMSTTEVAERFDVSRRTVLNWCRTGRVQAVQAGAQWRILRASLPDAA